ncbi:hypothetical protein Dimus_027698 [Dionaea muscipula]
MTIQQLKMEVLLWSPNNGTHLYIMHIYIDLPFDDLKYIACLLACLPSSPPIYTPYFSCFCFLQNSHLSSFSLLPCSSLETKEMKTTMENSAPAGIAKRLWGIVHVMFFMLRKGISKRKLLVDLNMIVKRGKIAGKALGNLRFHHHHHHHCQDASYEFSCSSTPSYHLPFCVPVIQRNKHHEYFSTCVLPQPPANYGDVDEDYNYDDDSTTVNLAYDDGSCRSIEVLPSGLLPGFGFGQSPMVRPLRITDSPVPAQDGNWEEDGVDQHVDEAAEEFIKRFYDQLKLQKKNV